MEEARFKAARKLAKQTRRQATVEEVAAVERLQRFWRARKSNVLLGRWLELLGPLKEKARHRQHLLHKLKVPPQGSLPKVPHKGPHS